MKYNFEIPLQGETLTDLKVDNVHGWKNFYVPFKEIKSNGFYIEETQTCLSHKMPIWWAIQRGWKGYSILGSLDMVLHNLYHF